MPLQDNQQLDDQILLDGDTRFSSGQASAVRDNMVKEGGYTLGRNIDFDTYGNVITRRGTARIHGDNVDSLWEDLTTQWQSVTDKWSGTITGPILSAMYFDTPSVERIVLADGANKIRMGSNTLAIDVVKDSGDNDATYSGSNVYFAQLVDKLYYCDGVGSLKYVDDSSIDQAIDAGRVTSVEVTVAGTGYTSVPAITFTALSGSGAAATAKLGYGGKVSDVEVDTAGSGYSVSGVGDNIPPTIAFAAAPSGGTTAEGVAHISQTPLKPKLLVSHTNRLFCTSADTSRPSDEIVCSDIIDGESWDLIGSSIRVGTGDGDPITALLPWYGFKLLVFKERSVWVVETNPLQDVSDWEIKLINNRVGCVAHKTVQQVGSDVFFLALDGVRSLSTIESGAQTAVSSPVSTPMKDFTDRINGSVADTACAVFYNNRYFLGLPLDSDTHPKHTLVYNAEYKAWVGYWDGWEPREFIVTAFGGEIRMNICDHTGSVYTWLDYVDDASASESFYKDQEANYKTKFRSRAYSFGDIYADKLGYQCGFDVDNTFEGTQQLSFYLIKNMDDPGFSMITEDGDTVTMQEATTLVSQHGETAYALEENVTMNAKSAHLQKDYNLLSRGKFKEVSFIVETTGGKLSLHSVRASGFADTITPER